jgi:hypothetical protein
MVGVASDTVHWQVLQRVSCFGSPHNWELQSRGRERCTSYLGKAPWSLIYWRRIEIHLRVRITPPFEYAQYVHGRIYQVENDMSLAAYNAG